MFSTKKINILLQFSWYFIFCQIDQKKVGFSSPNYDFFPQMQPQAQESAQIQ